MIAVDRFCHCDVCLLGPSSRRTALVHVLLDAFVPPIVLVRSLTFALNSEVCMKSTERRNRIGDWRSVRIELAPRGTWIELASRQVGRSGRPCPATVRDRRHGEAEELGQGVQPQPPNRLAPQRERFGSGEPFPVAQRQRSSRPQAASGEWGAKPRAPREARLPPSDLRCAQAVPAGHGVGASSTEAQPKSSESVANRRRRLRRR